MQMFCLVYISIHPLPNLRFTIVLKTHPYFKAAKALALFETMNIKLVALIFLPALVSEVCVLYTERCSKAVVIFYKYCPRIQWCIKPFMWINGHTICQV